MTVQKDAKSVEVNLPTGGLTAQIAATVDRLVLWLARHWLAVFNFIVAVFVGLPFLAPILMHLGATSVGRLIYTVYSPACHQLPERSFFLFGPQGVYSVSDLEASGALPAGLSIFQREVLRFIGMPKIGYKVAICERDVALYGSILLSGLIFGIIRHYMRKAGHPLPKLPLWGYALLLLPMAVDGTTQLLGLRASTWQLRIMTGGLFGAATVWLAYPYVQDAMDDVMRSTPGRHPAPY